MNCCILLGYRKSENGSLTFETEVAVANFPFFLSFYMWGVRKRVPCKIEKPCSPTSLDEQGAESTQGWKKMEGFKRETQNDCKDKEMERRGN